MEDQHVHRDRVLYSNSPLYRHGYSDGFNGRPRVAPPNLIVPLEREYRYGHDDGTSDRHSSQAAAR